MKQYKKIYDEQQVLVSDELISSSDGEITDAIPGVQPGMIIFNAGKSVVKQLSFDGRWISVASDGLGSGIDAEQFATKEELAGYATKESLGSYATKDEVSTIEANAKKGVSSITLTRDADGKITGGTVTFVDKTTAAIAITDAET